MNRDEQTSRRSGRILRGLLIAMGLCAAPIVVLAVVVLSYLGLDANASALRRAVIGSGRGQWTAKIELTAGRATLAAAGSALRFAHNPEAANARAALRVVNHASVGIYEGHFGARTHSSREVLGNADSVMRQRGWSRLLCVVGHDETVLVYASDSMQNTDNPDLCMAVASGQHWVIASAGLDASALASVLQQYAGNSRNWPEIDAGFPRGKERAVLRL